MCDTNPLHEACERFKQTKQFFLEAIDDYDCYGPQLEEKVKQHADRFLHEPRARTLQDEARSVRSEIGRFSSIRSSIVQRIAFLQIDLNTRITGTALKISKEEQRRFEQTLDELQAGLLGRTVSIEPKKKDSDRKPGDKFSDSAAVVIDEASKIQQIATGLIYLRKSILQGFAKENLNKDPKDIIRAIKNVAADISADALKEALLILAKTAGEEVFVFMKIYNIWRDIRERLLDIHEPYRPSGPEDCLLELALDPREQNAIFEEIVQGLRPS